MSDFGFAMFPRLQFIFTYSHSAFVIICPILTSPSSTTYYLSYFHAPLSSLALSMWIQSAIKHILTQGDSLLIAVLTTTHDQGIYALAANYGSLIARMLFQPIEEASRNLFAKLLSKQKGKSRVETENLTSAANILGVIMKLYMLLSVFAAALGPPFAPIALKLVAGSRWAEGDAGAVLASYCYYIPLLAINGVTEAFVQSVATERELAKQSAWMFAFSFAFAGIGWTFLSVLGWGARGLVAANAVNMVLRILWSAWFISGYFKRNKGAGWGAGRMMPSGILVAAAVGAGAAARGVVEGGSGLVREIGMGGVLGVGLVAVW